MLRYAKTAAVSGRTTASGGCADFVIAVSERSIRGYSVEFSETGSVVQSCGADPELTLNEPIFSESGAYYVPAVTAYDKNGNVTFRTANDADFGGNVGTTAKTTAILVDGSNLRAFPMTCSDPVTCLETSSNQAVRIKMNLAYRQPMNRREKNSSQDVLLDLRTGNVEVRNPTAP